ncbi:transmembrane ascorbate ferrireductase 1-like [Olea europaea subsp. europaea]|uniref:ascorbate ferrireductase (transmembrane) n=1 Tax=Olea europaea subsp. europaea TaxID=158383 RepID=A0A8S0RVD0_OLEEU|nr:transmembrane ascorbate ferrireductase 1-like [Olea europaea subsp. europaea]
MAIGMKAMPFSFVAHFLAVVGAILVLIWCISFRGGLAWEAPNKNLIFNSYHYRIVIAIFQLRTRILTSVYLVLRKKLKKLIHLVLHAIALILGIIGIYTAFKFHNESNIANLYSLHSWLGIGVIILYGIQWIYGFLIFFYPGGATTIRSQSLPWHVLFGLFVYILAVGTATLGYLEKLTFLQNSGVAKYGSEAFLVNFTAIVTILFGVFVFLTILSQPPQEDEYGYSAI